MLSDLQLGVDYMTSELIYTWRHNRRFHPYMHVLAWFTVTWHVEYSTDPLRVDMSRRERSCSALLVSRRADALESDMESLVMYVQLPTCIISHGDSVLWI